MPLFYLLLCNTRSLIFINQEQWLWWQVQRTKKDKFELNL